MMIVAMEGVAVAVVAVEVVVAALVLVKEMQMAEGHSSPHCL
jgi:hypothetical protein